MAITPQDERRARCKGMIYPSASKTTVPYNYNPGCRDRRPAGKLGITDHIEAGRIIKTAMRSEFSRSAVYTRMSPLWSELENWVALELGPGLNESCDFNQIYYGWTDDDQSFLEKLCSKEDVATGLRELTKKLKGAYPDSAPLRKQLRRVEMSRSLLEQTG